MALFFYANNDRNIKLSNKNIFQILIYLKLIYNFLISLNLNRVMINVVIYLECIFCSLMNQ